MAQRLENLQDLHHNWENFASGPAHLAFRKIARDVTTEMPRDLLEKLKYLQTLFPDTELFHRLFQRAPKLTPSREQEWIESRRCVVDVASSLLSQGIPPHEILISISHTKDGTVAIGTYKTPEVTGIGVDLELTGRDISKKAFQAILLEGESKLPLSPIQFWNIKEACFKSDHFHKGSVMTDYLILEFEPSTGRGRAKRSSDSAQSFLYQVIEFGPYSLAFALTCICH